MTFIKIKINNKGRQEATYWKAGMTRSLPIAIAEAEMMIAAEKAEQVEKFFWQA